MGKTKTLILLLFAAALYLTSGCVPPTLTRANPRLQEIAPRIHTVAVLPADIKVYQIDAGGVHEEIAEWSTQARTNIVGALGKELGAKLDAAIKFLDEESLAEEKARLEETRALYGAVSVMVFLHAFPNPDFPSHLFAEKQSNFDYALGGEVSALANGAGALLLLDAEDHVWTPGRQALQTLGVILGIGAGVATGVVAVPQLGGGTSIRAALVDSRTGDILWMNVVGAGAGQDLRSQASASEMVSQLFRDFPVSYDRPSSQEEAR